MTALDTPTTPAAPAATHRPARNLGLWTLQILLTALFAFAGVNKLLGLQQEMVENFARLGLGEWFRYFVGVLELTGAVGLVVPRLAAYAAVWLAAVMLGAVITHLTVQPPAALAAVPAVLGGLLLAIARARWPQPRLAN
jgi:uncharacterized membrane protein YphA (DoxX/SURF4 family)